MRAFVCARACVRACVRVCVCVCVCVKSSIDDVLRRPRGKERVNIGRRRSSV